MNHGTHPQRWFWTMDGRTNHCTPPTDKYTSPRKKEPVRITFLFNPHLPTPLVHIDNWFDILTPPVVRETTTRITPRTLRLSPFLLSRIALLPHPLSCITALPPFPIPIYPFPASLQSFGQRITAGQNKPFPDPNTPVHITAQRRIILL